MRVFRNNTTEEIDEPDFLNLLNTCIDDTSRMVGLQNSVEGDDPRQIYRRFWFDDPKDCARLIFKNIRVREEWTLVDFDLLPPEGRQNEHQKGTHRFLSYDRICGDVLVQLNEIRSFYPPDSQTP